LKKLHEQCKAVLSNVQALGRLKTDAQTESPLPSLNEILHQDAITRSMKNLIASGQNKSLLLYGGDCGQRRQLALAYARSVMCESRETGKWPACGACTACRDGVNGLGLIELRLIDSKIDGMREKLADLSFNPITRNRVVVIDGLDMDRSLEEAFLDALEAGRPLTTFILIATTLDKLKLATSSRCFTYRVKSVNLGNKESRKLSS
jgi:DNA polymerase III gamma/tau subunit